MFHERLKVLRKSKGISQKQVALDTDLSERNYQRYEAGDRKPMYEALIALADYFDVSLDYLVGRSDEPERR